MIKIVVCLKMVPGKLINAEAGGFIINPYDLFVLEKLAELKKSSDISVIGICMGGESARDGLIRSKALVCDDIYWLNDIKFAQADTIATTKTLTAAIKKYIPDADAVICGGHAIDGETGQVPAELSEKLGITYFSSVADIESFGNDSAVIVRRDERQEMTVRCRYPFLLSVDSFLTYASNLNVIALKRAQKWEYKIISAEELGIASTDCGASGSKTKVINSVNIIYKKESIEIGGSIKEKADHVKKLLQQ